MPIAISVVVKPSRWLLALVAALCLAVILIGMAIAFDILGETAPAVRWTLAAACIFLAFLGFCHTAWNRKVHHMDISVTGQIRLTEVNASNGSCQELNWPHLGKSVAMRLLKNSTLWPHLLLLRLQADNGKITVVPILPDCVSRDSFRALSVACRWIAAHNRLDEHDRP